MIDIAGELQAPLLMLQLVEACLPQDVCTLIRSYIGGEVDIKNHFIDQMVLGTTKTPYKECKKKSAYLLLQEPHQIVKPIPIGYHVESKKIVFSKDRRRAAAYSDNHIVLSPVAETNVAEFSKGIYLDHAGIIHGVCFNPQSTLLLSWAFKHSCLDVKIWDMSGKCCGILDLGFKAKMNQIMFNHNGTRLLITAEYTNLKMIYLSMMLLIYQI